METEDRFYAILAELRRDREEQARKRDANQEELRWLHEEIMAQAKKHDRSIGALGARWGTPSEQAFRDALAGILEENFGVQAISVIEYDDRGEVFGLADGGTSLGILAATVTDDRFAQALRQALTGAPADFAAGLDTAASAFDVAAAARGLAAQQEQKER